MKKNYARIGFYLLLLLASLLLVVGCSGSAQDAEKTGGENVPVFKIGAIPDQDISTLTRRFGIISEYLSEETGLKIEYVPSVNYAALVTAFERGEIHLAWFGGLTGVQARAVVPEAEAIAQRPRDEQFHSVFIAQVELPVEKLVDLQGLRFTFGSESSTSGHLMPRYFLMEAGIDPLTDFDGDVNFSTSHDNTWKLVESGAFQAGVLNEAVWEKAVQDGKVDISKVRVLYTTPAYYDYNWTINKVDEAFGQGTKQKVKEALLAMGDEQAESLELFQTDGFIETNNKNYEAIRQVAKELGIVK